MEKRRDIPRISEGPIRKPKFPLPQDFGRLKKEAPLSLANVPLKDQRAHFYRKETSGSGAPVYDFVLTARTDVEESH